MTSGGGPGRRRGRWRLGPSDSMGGWSPSTHASSRNEDTADIDEWIRVISEALEEHGEIGRKRLAELVGARYWGPGAFARALREGSSAGAFRRVARNRYAPPAA